MITSITVDPRIIAMQKEIAENDFKTNIIYKKIVKRLRAGDKDLRFKIDAEYTLILAEVKTAKKQMEELVETRRIERLLEQK